MVASEPLGTLNQGVKYEYDITRKLEDEQASLDVLINFLGQRISKKTFETAGEREILVVLADFTTTGGISQTAARAAIRSIQDVQMRDVGQQENATALNELQDQRPMTPTTPRRANGKPICTLLEWHHRRHLVNKTRNGPLFSTQVGASVREKCARNDSVMLSWSIGSLHWLSYHHVVPPALNPQGSTCVNVAATAEVRAAFEASAAEDWAGFLAWRAVELRPGGFTVISLPVAAKGSKTDVEVVSREHRHEDLFANQVKQFIASQSRRGAEHSPLATVTWDPVDAELEVEGARPHWAAFDNALQGLLAEKAVTPLQARALTLPLYYRTAEEAVASVPASMHCRFAQVRRTADDWAWPPDSVDTPEAGGQHDVDAVKEHVATSRAAWMRAWTYSYVKFALGSATAELFYQRLQLLQRAPHREAEICPEECMRQARKEVEQRNKADMQQRAEREAAEKKAKDDEQFALWEAEHRQACQRKRANAEQNSGGKESEAEEDMEVHHASEAEQAPTATETTADGNAEQVASTTGNGTVAGEDVSPPP
ncbi:hypothetical protein CYMTET_24227 [Cymbomonas tetramitiformis]|uniref:Uncharacterized protein n=1 Tax=Cymbomonas tetramitiformis TaxID=36881 RepID=A0AAE0FWZ6_9CHLO|nr:hypothetical protein CYMTET_24227 [Cymbomonas tetramitiformis]